MYHVLYYIYYNYVEMMQFTYNHEIQKYIMQIYEIYPISAKVLFYTPPKKGKRVVHLICNIAGVA